VTVRNIKCDVKYKSDFNAVVKRIQQDVIGGRTNNNYKKPRIGAVVQDKDIVQRPSGKLPKGLDQNDLTRYVASFHFCCITIRKVDSRARTDWVYVMHCCGVYFTTVIGCCSTI